MMDKEQIEKNAYAVNYMQGAVKRILSGELVVIEFNAQTFTPTIELAGLGSRVARKVRTGNSKITLSVTLEKPPEEEQS
jgi:hypothetical protein